jgi:general secretion pathway protein B
MSYILDALKKSEKERQRGTVPDLLTVQDALEQKTKKRLMWPCLLLAALLLNAGLLLWWLGTWQTKKTTIVAQSTTEKQLDSKVFKSPSPTLTATKSPRVNAGVYESKNSVAKPAEKLLNVVQQNQQVQAKTDLYSRIPDKQIPTVNTKDFPEISSIVPQQSPVITNHSSVEPQTNTYTRALAEKRVFNMKELPLSVQQGLPAFSISAFVYSIDPTIRMVKINGQAMREGQDLIAGLKLEEITQNGVIFSYQNYRFRIGLK